MNDLAIYEEQLPEKIEDVAKFLLIAPEKAVALKAEIRAIKNLHLAQEVYEQKQEEQRRLCELILDASVKLGEFTKALPKANGRRPEKNIPSTEHIFNHNPQPKNERIKDMGFTHSQISRFETLADNRDLVELEKATAREENRMPTRTNVITMSQARHMQCEKEISRIDSDAPLVRAYEKFDFAFWQLPEPNELANAMIRETKYSRADAVQHTAIEDITTMLQRLAVLKNYLIEGGYPN